MHNLNVYTERLCASSDFVLVSELDIRLDMFVCTYSDLSHHYQVVIVTVPQMLSKISAQVSNESETQSVRN